MEREKLERRKERVEKVIVKGVKRNQFASSLLRKDKWLTSATMSKCFKCNQLGHMKNDCPMLAKEGQVVKAYALNTIPSSLAPPLVQEKGKGITMEGMLLVNDITMEGIGGLLFKIY